MKSTKTTGKPLISNSSILFWFARRGNTAYVLLASIFVANSGIAAEAPLLSATSQFRKEYLENKLSIYNETIFYTWQEENGISKGRQTIIPWTFSYNTNNFYFGVRRAWIDSENKTPGERGRVITWSDTSLSFSYLLDKFSWPVRLTFDYNHPNGKATLNQEENNAIMDSYLVWQTQFGEGKNFTPGINISRALSKKDTIGLGLSYSKKGKYDPNSDTGNDVIDPGDEIIATAQYSHNDDIWWVNAGIIATRFSETKRNDIDYYQKGTGFNYSLGGGMALPWEATRGMDVAFSSRYSKSDKDKNFDAVVSRRLQEEEENSNSDTFSSSLTFGINRGQHRFSLSGDYLEAKKNDYPVGDINHNAGKTKNSIGIGYGYTSPDNRIRISVNAKKFSVRDKSEIVGASDTKYKGNNFSFNFSYNF